MKIIADIESEAWSDADSSNRVAKLRRKSARETGTRVNCIYGSVRERCTPKLMWTWPLLTSTNNLAILEVEAAKTAVGFEAKPVSLLWIELIYRQTGEVFRKQTAWNGVTIEYVE